MLDTFLSNKKINSILYEFVKYTKRIYINYICNYNEFKLNMLILTTIILTLLTADAVIKIITRINIGNQIYNDIFVI